MVRTSPGPVVQNTAWFHRPGGGGGGGGGIAWQKSQY
jgi:hypothetical protein